MTCWRGGIGGACSHILRNRPHSFRGIYFAKYYGKGGGKWCRGKMKNEAVRKKGKENEEKNRESDFFFVNIWHTFVDNCILT